MDRASRLIVTASTGLAAVTHVWLVDWQPGLPAAAAVAFAGMFLLARVAWQLAIAITLAGTFLAPALLGVGFDRSDAFARPDYHLLIVWLAALSGTIFARADPQRWHLPLSWRAPVAAWALLMALTWPIVAAREIDFSLTAARALHSTNPLLEATPRLSAAFVVIFALTQLLGILWVDFLFDKFAGRSREAGKWVLAPLLCSAAIAASVGVYQRFVDIDFLNAHIWSNMQRAGGLMLDANAFGTGVAFLAPASIAFAWWTSRGMTLALLVYAALAAGMWAAGSRTALLVFSIGSGALAIAALRERGLWQPRIARLVLLAGITGFIIAAAVVPRDYTSANPIARAFARVPRFEGEDMRRFGAELWNRFGYGTAANQMMLDYPVSGVGVGAFYVVAPEFIYRETGRILASDNAQNWWRQQTAELGIVGAVPALWASFLVLQLCRPRARRDAPPAATALRGTVIGLGVASLLGVPTQSPAIMIAFGAVLFWLADISIGTTAERKVQNATSLVLLTLVLIVTLGLAWSARGDLRVPMRALRAGVPYSYGLTPPQEVSAFGEVRWMARHAVLVTPAKSHWLRITFWAPYSDIARQPVELTLAANGSAPVTRHLFAEGPTSFYVEAADKAGMVELRASRELFPDRALQVATTWHTSLPSGTPADHVLALNDR